MIVMELATKGSLRAYLDRHWRDRAEALGRGARVFVHAAERRPWEPS